MKVIKSLHLKAAFLLTVFALNIVVGFACSVGVDMSFNTKHHGDEEATEAIVHIHKGGKEHVHQQEKESHGHDQSHNHDEANKYKNSKSGDGNCCTDNVKEFQDLDKSVPVSQNILHPVFFTAFVAAYYNTTLLLHTDIVKDIKPFVRGHHPPIPDIRIAIQSFQI